MIEIVQTGEFRNWLKKLADRRASEVIAQRLVRLQSGLFGDVKFFDGIGELRIHVGPGYRLYFIRKGTRSWSCFVAAAKELSAGISIAQSCWPKRFNMALETFPFDAAEFLGSGASQAELLADAFASGQAGYIANALGVVARARGMTKVAHEAGVTREALYKALSPDGDPRLTTLLGVMKALGIRLAPVQMGTSPESAR